MSMPENYDSDVGRVVLKILRIRLFINKRSLKTSGYGIFGQRFYRNIVKGQSSFPNLLAANTTEKFHINRSIFRIVGIIIVYRYRMLKMVNFVNNIFFFKVSFERKVPVST